jgi:hypothetical protein
MEGGAVELPFRIVLNHKQTFRLRTICLSRCEQSQHLMELLNSMWRNLFTFKKMAVYLDPGTFNIHSIHSFSNTTLIATVILSSLISLISSIIKRLLMDHWPISSFYLNKISHKSCPLPMGFFHNQQFNNWFNNILEHHPVGMVTNEISKHLSLKLPLKAACTKRLTHTKREADSLQ